MANWPPIRLTPTPRALGLKMLAPCAMYAQCLAVRKGRSSPPWTVLELMSHSTGGRNSRLAFSEEVVARLSASVDAHDGRTGIFLAAIALLVTGGLASLSDSGIRDARFVLPGGSALRLPAVTVALFLLFTVAAATYLVLSLGPPEPPPRSTSEPSLVRASSIERNQWQEFLARGGDHLEALREEVYSRDARYLAYRALYKYQRLVEARAAFFLSLPFLLIFVILVTFLGAAHQDNVRLSGGIVASCSVILFLTTFIAGQDRVRIDLIDRSVEGLDDLDQTRREDSQTFIVLTLCLAANAALVLASVLVMTGNPADYLIPIGSFLVTLPAAWKVHDRRRHHGTGWRALDRLPPQVLAGLGVPGMLLGLIPAGRPFCLIVAFLPSFFFEGIRLLDFYFTPFQVSARVGESGTRSATYHENPSPSSASE